MDGGRAFLFGQSSAVRIWSEWRKRPIHGLSRAIFELVYGGLEIGAHPFTVTAGIALSWRRLRDILSVQRRVTATFRQRDGRTLHVRKSTNPEPELLQLYQMLGIDLLPGGTKKLIV